MYICSLWYHRSLQVIVYMQSLVSSLCAGDSHLQRVTIPEAAYIQLRHRRPEVERGNAQNM
jgi:hypothetical protein